VKKSKGDCQMERGVRALGKGKKKSRRPGFWIRRQPEGLGEEKR